MSFVFFDTETTGLRSGFDQIVRFAAIRTDASLNEMGRLEVRSRLLPHVLPHPQALLTNGLTVDDLTDPALPSHYVMVSEIEHTLRGWSPAIFVGFNSIRFDEEMLRQALFQNLYPPYLTSQRGNCRADALSLVMAADAVSPAQIVVPIGPDGRRTFRLEQLAAANGIVHRAHDALSDAAATLDLCRLVAHRAPELWQRFARFSNKAAVADFVDAGEAFVFTEFFGAKAYHAPVVCIGGDPDQPNGRLCLGLDQDLQWLAAATNEDLSLWLAKKPCPVRRLRINAAPTLTAHFDAAGQMLGGLTLEDIEARAAYVLGDPQLCARLVAAYQAKRPAFPANATIEARIYDGFPDRNDEARLRAFQEAPWPDRFGIVETLKDDRLRWFGRRVLYYEARALMPASVRKKVEHHLLDRLFDASCGYLTFEQAIAEVNCLMAEVPDAAGLSTYRSYLDARSTRASNYRVGLPPSR